MTGSSAAGSTTITVGINGLTAPCNPTPRQSNAIPADHVGRSCNAEVLGSRIMDRSNRRLREDLQLWRSSLHILSESLEVRDKGFGRDHSLRRSTLFPALFGDPTALVIECGQDLVDVSFQLGQ